MAIPHAATWVPLARLVMVITLCDFADAESVERARREGLQRHKVEPYVMGTFTVSRRVGRGGWTRHGAAAWFIASGSEILINAAVTGHVNPVVRRLAGFRLQYRFQNTIYHRGQNEHCSRGVTLVELMESPQPTRW
jgi:hypothetical protein